MKKFTKEETMLMMLYNPGSRKGMDDDAFQQLDLYPE